MKRILCLIDVLNAGGAERQMVGLSSLLCQKGYQVDLVTYHQNRFYADLVERSGVNLISISVKSNKFSKLIAIYKIAKEGKYDALIAYKDGATMIACLLKILRCHFKIIVSERVTTQFLTMRDRIKFLLYRYADYIVPNSYSQETFIKNNFSRLTPKLCTITNFTDTVLFSPTQTFCRKPLKILTVARLSQQKNILNYIEAVRIIKGMQMDVHFEWFGQVEEEFYAKKCRDKINEYGIDDIFSFYPPSSDVAKEYQSCDVFCLPSNYEGFPNVICEAMSCGKPILCSRICDNPTIVKDGVNGMLFDPEKVTDIVDKIEIMCKLKYEEREEIGLRNREKAIRLFSSEAFIMKYTQLIES